MSLLSRTGLREELEPKTFEEMEDYHREEAERLLTERGAIGSAALMAKAAAHAQLADYYREKRNGA